MFIHPIASGSGGNCYLIDDNHTRLLIECGIPWKRIQKALGFNTSTLSGVLCSHVHQDHCKTVADVLKAGIDCFMSKETAEALGVIGHHRLNIIKAGERFQIETWTVLGFEAIHDVPCLGYLLASGSERLLYLTDSAYSIYRFEGITHAMIECNFQDDILINNVMAGLPAVVARRVRRSHMSLEQLVSLLKANDLSRLKEVHLLHLSAGNSNERQMIERIQTEIGCPVWAARE